jgi:hypothetical protein
LANARYNLALYCCVPAFNLTRTLLLDKKTFITLTKKPELVVCNLSSFKNMRQMVGDGRGERQRDLLVAGCNNERFKN